MGLLVKEAKFTSQVAMLQQVKTFEESSFVESIYKIVTEYNAKNKLCTLYFSWRRGKAQGETGPIMTGSSELDLS